MERGLEGYSHRITKSDGTERLSMLAGEEGTQVKGQQLAGKGQAWFSVVRLEGHHGTTPRY